VATFDPEILTRIVNEGPDVGLFCAPKEMDYDIIEQYRLASHKGGC
jgi:hypothetical protein